MSNSILPKPFCENAVAFIDLFGINWHGIDSLGEASNFIHAFKGISERFNKIDITAVIDSINDLSESDQVDDDMGFNAKNRGIVLDFLKEAIELKDGFNNLNNEPDFIANLEKIKKQSAQLNFLNARSIIYHNCLA
jgi:hypothetical protein